MIRPDLIGLLEKSRIPYRFIRGFNLISEVEDDEWAEPKKEKTPLWEPNVDVVSCIDQGDFRGYQTSQNQLNRNERGY